MSLSKAHISNLMPRAMLVCVIIATMLAATCANAFADSGFSVSPMMVKQSVAAGKSAKQTITITNTYSKSVTFTITREDFGGSKTDPSAAPVLYGGIVDSPISGAGWLNLSASSITIGAGQAKSVTVTTKVPKGASDGHFGAIVVSSSTQTLGSTVSLRSQVAVLFLMNSGSSKPPELVIRDVTVVKPGVVRVRYKNNGTTYVEPTVKVIYRDPITGETVTKTKSVKCDGIALPDSVAECTIKTKPGDTSLLRPGDVELASNGVRVRAKIPRQWSSSGLSSLLFPAVGIGLLALYFLRGRRRGKGDEDPLSDF